MHGFEVLSTSTFDLLVNHEIKAFFFPPSILEEMEYNICLIDLFLFKRFIY